MELKCMENSEQNHLNLAGETLSPCSREESAHDAQNLFDAMKDEKNRNVALVGPFASGKSTIIQTLIDKYEGKGKKLFKESSGEPTLKESKRYLFHFKTQVVSLAKIGCNNSNKRNSGDKGEENDFLNEWDDEVDNSIEKSILQQFVFSKKKAKLPDSKIGRLGHLIMPSLTISGGFALLAIFSILLIFLINEIPLLSDENYWPFIRYAFFATATLFGGLLLIISNVRNLTIKYSELEISCDTDDSKNQESLFNKFLDEIIYYFRKTKINTVFFEDLERFKNLEIFLKLRELNYLLNNNEELKKSIGKITFVYAINNEMFDCGTDRVKFFDYLYSISPSFTPSNREELLYKGLTEDKVLNWKDFDKESIMILSSYIDDRRMLISVINDLRYSWQKLDEETKKQNNSARQLLALTIYKNKYPQKYAELEKGEGELVEAIKTLQKEYAEKATEAREKPKKIQDDLNLRIHEDITDLERCFCMFLGVLISKGENFYYDSNDMITVDSAKDLYRLLTFENNQYVKCSKVQYKRITVGKMFDFLPELPVLLKSTSSEKVSAISCKRKELEKAIEDYQKFPVDEFDLAVSYPEIINQSKEFTELLKVLLVRGFIDHNYRRFLYRGMAGFLSPNDKAFVNNINIKGGLKSELQLDEPKLILERLSLSDCKEMNILNFDLIDYLFGADRIEKPKEVESIKDQLKLNNEIVKQFIGDYFLNRQERSNKRLLFFLLENRFDVFEILNKCGLDDLTMNFLEKCCLIECNPTFIEKQTRIQEVVKCFAEKANECGFYRGMKMEYVSLLSKYGCIVDDLNEITKIEVFKEINRTNMWKINYSNLSILCKNLFPKVPVDELLKKDFESIRGIDVALCLYLEQNIDRFVSEILLQLPALNLHEKMIQKILLSGKVLDENKKKVIEKQNGNIAYVPGYSPTVISELMQVKKLLITMTDLSKISSKQDLNDIRVYLNDCFNKITDNDGSRSFKSLTIILLSEDSPLNLNVFELFSNHARNLYNSQIRFDEIKDTGVLLSLIDKMDVNSLRNYSNHINSLNEPKVTAQYFLKFINQSQPIPSTLALTPRALKIVLEQRHGISETWHNAIKLGYETEQDGVEELIGYVCDKKIDLGQLYALFAKSGNLSSQKFLLSLQVSFKADLSGKLNVIKMYDDCLKELIEKKSAAVPSGNDSIKIFRFIIKKEKLSFELDHKEGRYILRSKDEKNENQ